MVNISYSLLVVSGIVLLAVLKMASTRALTTAESVRKATSATDRYPIEVPKAGPVDWDRDPPPVRHPDGHNADTESTPPQEPTPDQTESHDPEPSELEFDWQFETDMSFDDVGGMDQLKAELRRDIIYPPKTDADLIEAMGLSAQNVLFHGPPGTGKTYMARALAGELDVPFVQLSGPKIQSKWINESASKVSSLFAEASQLADQHGGALVFIDELDTVLSSRTEGANAHAEDSKVVNEFLAQLQDTDANNIVFIGATNRADALDDAAVRAGRIDKHVEIPKPDRDTRKAILKTQLHTRPHKVTEANMAHAAHQLEGVSAADITSIVETAARRTVFSRAGDTIRWGDLQMAIEEFLTTRES